VLEAMACGSPVVVTNRGALPEVVAGAGVIVEPDAESIASGLITVLSDSTLAASLAADGRSRALELSWERTADGWLQALQAARADHDPKA
jgi:glycosyltransferase involved in cell wall biosynthesis